ncbi:MAG: aminopeptidase P family protein, partial [Acidimicrobiia bacterium]|nr:aminopeptidase P family protein [Acidimicrobiia bacterium]
KAGEDAQLRIAAPGVLASTLFATAVESVEDAGLRPYRRHHCGHGIGREVYEPPIVSPGTELPLQSGMVLCFETPFYEIGWGGMMVEDTVVITADGNQRLNHSDRSLRVVDG